ncbi:transglycosylase domain-containing protein [Consotaella aegiceratis]|uniref:transglycosylase domain-containing protein n=1 Tax=Consotaella aegiceratis TaxID=3097961 RepID=UPI002F424F17
MAAGRRRERIEPTFQSDEPTNEEFRLSDDDRAVPTAGQRKKPERASRGARVASGAAAPSASKAGSGAGGNGGGGRRRRRRSFLGHMFRLCLALGFWGALAVCGVVAYFAVTLPQESWAIPERPPNVKIVSVSGKLLANRGITGGEAVSLNEMSPYIPEAVIAIEDRRFYSHYGVDPIGIIRAFAENLAAGSTVQGGSTLTQQLAKNIFLNPEQTLERKIQEAILALWLEHKFTKDQILEMYLNRVYFGSGATGIDAAARRYFNKSPKDVNLGEAALLAGLLKAPSRLSPARDPQAAKERADVVLAAMLDEGVITRADYEAALKMEPTQAKSYWDGAENYVADLVMKDLKDLVGQVHEDVVVETTIDVNLEQAAESAIRETVDGANRNVSQGALVAVDGTGAIRAMVGGRDYAESQFNRAVDAKRQPGSAFKPFVYETALEFGWWPEAVMNDAPTKIGNWTPENYEREYKGPVTLAYALAHSLNTIAAQLTAAIGPEAVIQTAHRLGITSPLADNASIALGTSEVSLLDLTSAYAPFSNGGYMARPYLISRIATEDGRVLFDRGAEVPAHVVSNEIVGMMNAMLTQVVEAGTGRRAKLDGWQAAGKTGTTQDFKDAWFVGYTSNLTAGVWLGNDNGAKMKSVTGGTLPAEAWAKFMTAAHAGLSPTPLPGDYVIGARDPLIAEGGAGLPGESGGYIVGNDPYANPASGPVPPGSVPTAGLPRREQPLPGSVLEGRVGNGGGRNTDRSLFHRLFGR